MDGGFLCFIFDDEVSVVGKIFYWGGLLGVLELRGEEENICCVVRIYGVYLIDKEIEV